MELSEEEKARFRAEEFYRDEVRRELIKKPSTGLGTIYEFLQTPLGNILVSTIAIGALSTLWACLINSYKDDQAKTALIADMDKEIEYRTFQLF